MMAGMSFEALLKKAGDAMPPEMVKKINEQLQQTRDTSPEARQQILNLEGRVMELKKETHQLEKRIRNLELAQ